MTIPLYNSDLESGTPTGWTAFTTEFGTSGGDQYPTVVDFDMDGDGLALAISKVAQFKSGKLSVDDDGYQGGGIYQMFHLSDGDSTLSAERAANENGIPWGALDGGLFELMVDDIVVDRHEFTGSIGPNQTQHKLMSGLHVVADGDHSVGVGFTRCWPAAPTVTQYVDDVNLDLAAPSSTDDTVTTEGAPDDGGCINQKGQENMGKGNNDKGGNSVFGHCGNSGKGG